MVIAASSFEEYIAQIPEDRHTAFRALRNVINANINPGFEEGMQYSFPSWYVPHSVFPDGYHCDPKQPLPFVSIASQKHFIAFYGCMLYNSTDNYNWFVEEYAKTGLKLDMGKSCVRFKKWDNLPLDLIGESVRRVTAEAFIADYLQHRPTSKGK